MANRGSCEDTGIRLFPFVDVAKGIGMILVILQHCLSYANTSPAQTGRTVLMVLSFHMPLFFFLSGFLFRKKEPKEFFSNKVQRLLIPVLLFGCINAALRLITAALSKDYIPFAGFWFLNALLYTSSLYYLVERLVDTHIASNGWRCTTKACITFGMLAFGMLWAGLIQGAEVPLAIACVGFFFFAAGALARKLCPVTMLTAQSPLLRISMLGAGILLLSVLWFTASKNTPVYMYISSYGDPILFICNALLGTGAVFAIAIAIGKNTVLEFLGKNSLIIMITHFPVYQLVMDGMFMLNTSRLVQVIAGIAVTLAIEWILVRLIQTILPVLTGKYIQ